GQGMGMGMGMGQGQGQGMGQGQQGMGQGMGQSQERNQTQGTGNRTPDGKTSNDKSQLANVKGDGGFLNLPPRQREMIRQALNGNVPPQFAGMIQQYNQNLPRAKQGDAKPDGPGR